MHALLGDNLHFETFAFYGHVTVVRLTQVGGISFTELF